MDPAEELHNRIEEQDQETGVPESEQVAEQSSVLNNQSEYEPITQVAPPNLAQEVQPQQQQLDPPQVGRKHVRQLDFTPRQGCPPFLEQQQQPPIESTLLKKCKQCNCKNSRCLKLYCECFASGVYCEGCNCVNCWNNAGNEKVRQEAVELTLERNPNAFRPKIGSNHFVQEMVPEQQSLLGKHNKGCHCKKSGCLKKYCECFQANIPCSDKCKCLDCRNFEGSDERKSVYQGAQAAYNMLYGHSTGMIGCAPSSPTAAKKRRTQDLIFVGHALKANQTKSGSKSAPAPPYRSLLTGVVQTGAVREFCEHLVAVSAETARSFKAAGLSESYPICLGDGDATTEAKYSSSNGSQPKSSSRETSPGTLAFMCDEEDPLSPAEGSPPESQDMQLFAEQERVILCEFRNCLHNIISIGKKRAIYCWNEIARREREAAVASAIHQ